MPEFTTRTDAEDFIAECIEAGDGVNAVEYDLDAITDEVTYITGTGTTDMRYCVTDDDEAFWRSVERHWRPLRMRWESDGAVDPDATFTVLLEAKAEDGEWDILDSEELHFHGNVASFQSETEWADTEDALLVRNGLDRDNVTETIMIG